MREIKDIEEFNNIVDNEDRILVDFYAPWCGPCKMITPQLEKINQENDDFDIIKVNIDEFPQLAREFSVTSVPTFTLFRKGEIKDTFTGANLDLINKTLGL